MQANFLRVGIVGCGRISDLHEMGYRGREDAHIVAVCDKVRRRARDKARVWGAGKTCADYRDLLTDPEIDLVEAEAPSFSITAIIFSLWLAT